MTKLQLVFDSMMIFLRIELNSLSFFYIALGEILV